MYARAGAAACRGGEDRDGVEEEWPVLIGYGFWFVTTGQRNIDKHQAVAYLMCDSAPNIDVAQHCTILV